MKPQHGLRAPLGPDWWGDDSDTSIVAWQKEAATDRRAVHSRCRPVYTERAAKEEEGGEDDRNEEKEWEIRSAR